VRANRDRAELQNHRFNWDALEKTGISASEGKRSAGGRMEIYLFTVQECSGNQGFDRSVVALRTLFSARGC